MFPTQQQSQQIKYHRTASHHINHHKHYQLQKNINSQNQDFPMEILRKRKQQVNNAKQQLIQAIRKYKQLKKQVNKNQKMAHIAKLTCIKLYGVKKHKIVNKSLIEEKNQRDQEQNKKRLQNVKKINLEQKYYRQLLKNQDLYRRYKIREQFKKYKISVQETIMFKNKLLEDQSKQKFIHIKNQQNRLHQKKKLLQNSLIEKSKDNYISKLEKQVKKIQAYNNLIIKMHEHQKSAIQQLNVSKLMESRAYQQIQSILKSDEHRQSFFLTQRRDAKSSLTSRKLSRKN